MYLISRIITYFPVDTLIIRHIDIPVTKELCGFEVEIWKMQ